ncbi:MAG: DMT family transporter [Actinomycetia bacterium]|nr:DMT family transporter [Actinomycetes bacterium]
MAGRSWVLAYLALALMWGMSFAFNQLSLESFTPLQITAGRMGLGGLTLLTILLVTKNAPRPNRTELRHLIILGVFGLALPFTLISFAQTQITSILAGLLNAATPLFAGIIITLLIPAERPDRTQAVGLVVGFAGIAVLIGVWEAFDEGFATPAGIAAMIGASLCYGFATSFSRLKLSASSLSGSQLSSVQLLAGAGMALLLLPIDPVPDRGGITWSATAALLVLGVLGTGVAMVLMWHVIRQAGSTIAATVTYAIPVVSTTIGVTLLAERLEWNEIVGGLIVIFGVVLTQWTQLTRRHDFGGTRASTTAETTEAG